jgi:hypothetical protein
VPRCARPLTRTLVHPRLEVSHPLLSLLPVSRRHGARVLLKSVQQDNQVPGALVEHAITSPCEPNPQLPQLSGDLRRGGELWRRVTWITAVEMLLDGIVDLRGSEGLDLQQLLEEVVDRFLSSLVSIEDGLRAATPSSHRATSLAGLDSTRPQRYAEVGMGDSGVLIFGTSSRSLSGLVVETRTGRTIVDEQVGIAISRLKVMSARYKWLPCATTNQTDSGLSIIWVRLLRLLAPPVREVFAKGPYRKSPKRSFERFLFLLLVPRLDCLNLRVIVVERQPPLKLPVEIAR